jgi:hypothetical protein
MSHISKIELEVKDLGILSQACGRLGLQFIRAQRTFKWYGKDGRCDHAIKLPGARYEIGIAKDKGRYELLCDYFDPEIEKAIGQKGGLLKQAYAAEKTKTEARRKGYTVTEHKVEAAIRLKLRIP